VTEGVSNSTAKSRSNRGTEATSIYIKNDTRIVTIILLDISINQPDVRNEGEAVSEGVDHSLDVDRELT
jgi:hypothetical protein